MEEVVRPPKVKSKKRSRLYIPWYAADEDIVEEGEDGWINYVRRNISHAVGEESPFPDSSWSYATKDSLFEEEDKDNKPDEQLREEVQTALYQCEEVDASNLKVIVLNGLVSLFGSVTSLLEKNAAQKAVQEVAGVWSVRNEIQIITPQTNRSYVE